MPGVSGEIFVITASNFPFHDSGRDNVIQCSSPCPRLRFQGSASELQVRIQWPPPCALPLSGSLPGWECTVEMPGSCCSSRATEKVAKWRTYKTPWENLSRPVGTLATAT